jgi:hypothetical protein
MIIYTNVTCAIGELVTQLIFLSNTIFCNLIEFPMTKTTQNSIILQLSSKISNLLSLNPIQ